MSQQKFLTEFKTIRLAPAEVLALEHAAVERGITTSKLIRSSVLAAISDRVAA
jgi:hypothetical protein